jgi:PAS domain S-box-containing protein
MDETAQTITHLHTELTALRKRMAALEAEAEIQNGSNAALKMELDLQHATLVELQDTMEAQGIVESELRQKLAEREVTQQAVEAERQQYQALFELAPDGYLVTDAAGVIREANRAAACLLGRPREQLLNLPLVGFVAKDASQAFLRLLRSLHTTPLEQPWEVDFHPPHGQPFAGELTVAVQPGMPSTKTRYHWLLRDVTARKEAEAALRQARAERQRLEREAQRAEHFALLGRLAAGVSHEIRNPLGAIALNVDLLAEEIQEPSPDSAAQMAQALADIKTDLGRLIELVEDYLSLVRVAALDRAPQDLGTAVRGWGVEMQAQAATRGMHVHLDGLEHLGTVAFHANTLRRTVVNLVQNALEAMSPGGTVTIAGQRTATHVLLQVRDTGNGIPADLLPQIFEPLYTTKPGGTGLGLYIVQEIVAAHGGGVTVESVAGQGTTFTLTLPVAPAAISQG